MTYDKSLCLAWVLATISLTSTQAAEVPQPGGGDPRVRYVDYKTDEVTVVNVRRGYVARVVLEDDEKITVAATGLMADCQNPDSAWCIRADVGTNVIWVKPKDGATRNNLELRTDRRDYSLDFKVGAETKTVRGKNGKVVTVAADPMYRVIFRYPVKLPPMSAFMAANVANSQLNEKAVLDQRLANAAPIARNWQYSMQIAKGSKGIAPAQTFDDGRFTYLKFPANREIPTFYVITPSGEEERINYHMEGDLVVVERMSRRFVLRLGKQAVGIWNDAYDPDGVAPEDGTTIAGVARAVKE